MSAATPANPARSTRRRPAAAARRRGLTLVEVLATIVMMAIVLPAAMQGIALCTSTSVVARQRSEAAALAEAKLSELIATGEWQFGALSGDFGEEWPDYRWSGSAAAWSADPTMTELYVRVYWVSRQQEREVLLTTLIYAGDSQAAAPI